MLMVGLTGGIGSGKSVAADRLGVLGAVIIDSDRIAREVVAPGTDGLAEITAVFGERVLADDGGLDRSALGEIVFRDPEARTRLERITHPRVRARTAALAAEAPPDAVVVNDVPLLVEVGLATTYHLVMVVRSAQRTRVDRLVRGRGMTAEEAMRRIAAQATDAQRQAVADVVLTNDGTLVQLHDEVDTLWRDRLIPYERNLRQRRSAPREPAGLVDANPSWPAQFDRLAARIRYVLGGDRRVDHIGSTAVPGLASKDVIDIQLTVDSLDEADTLAEALARAGFPRCPGEWWDVPRYPGSGARWAKRLHCNADPGRPVNLHVRVAGSPGWRFALLMRDHLHADPGARAAYLAVKRRLIADGLDMRGYAERKEPWFDTEYEMAQRWAVATGWHP